MPFNGALREQLNNFQVPFSQKWNAYYVATWFSSGEGAGAAQNRFRNAIQILQCDTGDRNLPSVSSQVFASECADDYDFGCNGALTCAVVDNIWRKIVGEIHREMLLSFTLAPTPAPTSPTPAPTPCVNNDSCLEGDHNWANTLCSTRPEEHFEGEKWCTNPHWAPKFTECCPVACNTC